MADIHLTNFLGVVSAIAGDDVSEKYATDAQDTRLVSGAISNRYGWQNVSAAPGSFSAGYLLKLHQGISSGSTVEGYTSVETIGANTRPYEINPSTGGRTVIRTAVPGHLELNASEWASVTFGKYGYYWNNADATYNLWRYQIGTPDSAENIASPTDPTTPIVLQLIKDVVNTTTGPYRKMVYAGVNPSTEVVYAGRAASGAISGDSIVVDHSGGNGWATVTITLTNATGGVEDHTNNDVLLLTMTNLDNDRQWFKWDPSKLVVTGINAAATEFELEHVAWDGSGNFQGGNDGISQVMVKYPKDTDRSLKNDITKIKLYYWVVSTGTGTNTNNNLEFGPVEIGCIHPEFWNIHGTFQSSIWWSYYWKNSTTSDVSAIVLPAVKADSSRFSGDLRNVGGVNYPMGVVPRLTAVGTAQSGVDKWVLVAARDDDPEGGSLGGPWRISGTFDDTGGALSQLYTDDYEAHVALSKYEDLDRIGGLIATDILCAFAHKGHMVWGVKGGKSNIRHANTASELQVFTEGGVVFNEIGGAADWTLSDDGADDPIAGHSVGASCVILGNRRAYAQSGSYGKTMTPFKNVPKSHGVAGRFASASWASDDGQAGVVYLSKDFDTVLFVTVSQLFDGTDGYTVTTINQAVTGKIRTFLGISNPTTDDIKVRADDISNSLWITYRDKAVVFRRPSILDGQRHWEFYSYTNTGNWVQWDFSQDYGIRALRSTGEFDEIEYDNSSNKDPITGALRDGGSAVAGYWESKDFHLKGTRVLEAWIERDTGTDTPAVNITSTRVTTSKTVASGKKRVRFPATQQGPRHKVKVTLGDNSSDVTSVTLKIVPAGERPGL